MLTTKVWIFELVGAFVTHEWLCKPCALARRALRNVFGHLVFTSVKQLLDENGKPRAVDGRCADCETRRQREARAA